MRLQKFLHLPTRQRHDGHDEITSCFPKHCLSSSRTSRSRSSRSRYSIKTLHKITRRSSLLALPATAIIAPRPALADPKPVGAWGKTTGSSTYIRIRPGQQTPVVAKVSRRTQVMVWGTFNGWYRVETTDHKFGWIFHDYVSVPNADKLHELSHFKAKKASDSTGQQTLYGKPEQLKKYYSRYKAPGAKKGLEKQGVRLASTGAAPNKTVAVKPHQPAAKAVRPVTNRPVVKPVVARPVVAPLPQTVAISPLPDSNLTPTVPPTQSTPTVAKPVVASAPRQVVTKVVTKKVVTKKAVKKTPQPVMRSAAPPKASAKVPVISALDILQAREQYLKSSPTSRHKTQPFVAPPVLFVAPKVEVPKDETNSEKTEDAAATVQPSALEIAPITPSTDAVKPIVGTATKTTTATKTVTTKTVNRGGSPRDYARWAMANGKLDNNKFGDGIAKQALSYRGMPYISGASNPNRGFDCSGLVYFLLRQRGYNPPRTAASLTSVGTSVSKNSLKPGDIVFFANTYKRGVSHVGIYIGNGKFVHAANSGSGVKTDSLSSSYYSRKYWGARRVK